VNRILTVLAAIGIAVGGYIHFHLWQGVYHHAPIREMFVLNVVASAFLAIAVFIPTRIAALAGAALAAGSLAALGLSRVASLPTPHGRWSEIGLAPGGQTFFGVSDTLIVIVAEALALVACLALVAVRSRRGARGAVTRRRTAPVPQWAMPL
jgi:hypothetical protein